MYWYGYISKVVKSAIIIRIILLSPPSHCTRKFYAQPKECLHDFLNSLNKMMRVYESQTILFYWLLCSIMNKMIWLHSPHFTSPETSSRTSVFFVFAVLVTFCEYTGNALHGIEKAYGGRVLKRWGRWHVKRYSQSYTSMVTKIYVTHKNPVPVKLESVVPVSRWHTNVGAVGQHIQCLLVFKLLPAHSPRK